MLITDVCDWFCCLLTWLDVFERGLNILSGIFLVVFVGAVKITPAHDINDFEVGKRHNLDSVTILSEDGRINENGGEFQVTFRVLLRLFLSARDVC